MSISDKIKPTDLCEKTEVLKSADLKSVLNDAAELAQKIMKTKVEKFLNDGFMVKRWIPVSEALPDDDTPVLISDKRKEVSKAWYDKYMHKFYISDSDYWYNELDVLAWMPMPSAYKPHEKE